VIERPETIASAIRIGNPASWKGALEAAQQSQGKIDMVSDEEILDAYSLLARMEGVFCEAASAASVAGLIKWAKAEGFSPENRIVCVLTGHGLKDPDTAVKRSPKPASVEAEMELVLRAMGILS